MANSAASGQLAGRYALALFELADQKKKLPAVAKDLEGLGAAIEGSEDLQRLINSPVLGRDAQVSAMDAILTKGKANAITKNFIGTVAGNARLSALPTIITAFQAELAKRNGEVIAEVTAARELTKTQMTALEKQLKTVVGSKVNLNLNVTVDEEIMGGLIIKVGSRMIDSSLKTKLSKLQNALGEADTSAAA